MLPGLSPARDLTEEKSGAMEAPNRRALLICRLFLESPLIGPLMAVNFCKAESLIKGAPFRERGRCIRERVASDEVFRPLPLLGLPEEGLLGLEDEPLLGVFVPEVDALERDAVEDDALPEVDSPVSASALPGTILPGLW